MEEAIPISVLMQRIDAALDGHLRAVDAMINERMANLESFIDKKVRDAVDDHDLDWDTRSARSYASGSSSLSGRSGSSRTSQSSQTSSETVRSGTPIIPKITHASPDTPITPVTTSEAMDFTEVIGKGKGKKRTLSPPRDAPIPTRNKFAALWFMPSAPKAPQTTVPPAPIVPLVSEASTSQAPQVPSLVQPSVATPTEQISPLKTGPTPSKVIKPTSAPEEPVIVAPVAPAIPPIIIRNVANWAAISFHMNENRIQFSKARTTRDGIRVQPTRIQDYRALARHLDSQNYEYHTYSLPDDKTIQIVIRDLPLDLDIELVEKDLFSQGFNPIKVARMKHPRTRNPMPLIMAEFPKSEKECFNLRSLCSIIVKIELPRKSGISAAQCHRCQRFHHAQKNCHAQVRCVKCGENHISKDCNKDPALPAKCANCNGAHTANYHGCPNFPKSARRAPSSANPPADKKPAPGANPKSPKQPPTASQARHGQGKKPAPQKSQAPPIKPKPAQQQPKPSTKDNIIITQMLAAVGNASNGKEAVAILATFIPALIRALAR